MPTSIISYRHPPTIAITFKHVSQIQALKQLPTKSENCDIHPMKGEKFLTVSTGWRTSSNLAISISLLSLYTLLRRALLSPHWQNLPRLRKLGLKLEPRCLTCANAKSATPSSSFTIIITAPLMKKRKTTGSSKINAIVAGHTP